MVGREMQRGAMKKEDGAPNSLMLLRGYRTLLAGPQPTPSAAFTNSVAIPSGYKLYSHEQVRGRIVSRRRSPSPAITTDGRYNIAAPLQPSQSFGSPWRCALPPGQFPASHYQRLVRRFSAGLPKARKQQGSVGPWLCHSFLIRPWRRACRQSSSDPRFLFIPTAVPEMRCSSLASPSGMVLSGVLGPKASRCSPFLSPGQESGTIPPPPTNPRSTFNARNETPLSFEQTTGKNSERLRNDVRISTPIEPSATTHKAAPKSRKRGESAMRATSNKTAHFHRPRHPWPTMVFQQRTARRIKHPDQCLRQTPMAPFHHPMGRAETRHRSPCRQQTAS